MNVAAAVDQKLIDSMPFARYLGMELVQADKEKIVAQLLVRPDLCTAGNLLHGGAMMALADSLGAIGAFLNLQDNARGTTTIESKTNFLGGVNVGTTATAQALPIHIGRRTSVWQTSIYDEQARRVALITQTQLAL